MTGSRFGIETVREAARRRVAETSLRELADEIPMSFSGLRSFLHGGNPQAATRGKLIAWYARSRSKGRSRVAPQDVHAAIALLAEYLGEASNVAIRQRRIRDILKFLDEFLPQ